MSSYKIGTPGVITGDNSTVRLDLANEPQPDALLMIDPACGGQARLSADGYVEAAPELLVEVAASSVSRDLHVKRQIYRCNGVCEYLVWRVLDRALDWFVLRAGEYVCLQPDAPGLLRSEVFPGLWLDATALLDGAMPSVFTALQQGLASAEHAALVTCLQALRQAP